MNFRCQEFISLILVFLILMPSIFGLATITSTNTLEAKPASKSRRASKSKRASKVKEASKNQPCVALSLYRAKTKKLKYKKSCHRNGKLKAETKYRSDGTRDFEKTYWPNSYLKTEIYYEDNGKLKNKEKVFYKNGVLKMEIRHSPLSTMERIVNITLFVIVLYPCPQCLLPASSL